MEIGQLYRHLDQLFKNSKAIAPATLRSCLKNYANGLEEVYINRAIGQLKETVVLRDCGVEKALKLMSTCHGCWLWEKSYREITFILNRHSDLLHKGCCCILHCTISI